MEAIHMVFLHLSNWFGHSLFFGLPLVVIFGAVADVWKARWLTFALNPSGTDGAYLLMATC